MRRSFLSHKVPVGFIAAAMRARRLVLDDQRARERVEQQQLASAHVIQRFVRGHLARCSATTGKQGTCQVRRRRVPPSSRPVMRHLITNPVNEFASYGTGSSSVTAKASIPLDLKLYRVRLPLAELRPRALACRHSRISCTFAGGARRQL